MRTVASTCNVEITVASEDLIEGKYIPYTYLSKKVDELEREVNDRNVYNGLRVKLHNAKSLGKLNCVDKAGICLVDVEKPMRTNECSIVLTFTKVA